MSTDGRIKINCKRVYDSGVLYLNYSDEIEKIQKSLDTCAGNILNAWNDDKASNNFIVSFEKHIKNMDAFVNFLGENGDLLKKTALKHSGIDSNFVSQLERSDINEI